MPHHPKPANQADNCLLQGKAKEKAQSDQATVKQASEIADAPNAQLATISSGNNANYNSSAAANSGISSQGTNVNSIQISHSSQSNAGATGQPNPQSVQSPGLAKQMQSAQNIKKKVEAQQSPVKNIHQLIRDLISGTNNQKKKGVQPKAQNSGKNPEPAMTQNLQQGESQANPKSKLAKSK